MKNRQARCAESAVDVSLGWLSILGSATAALALVLRVLERDGPYTFALLVGGMALLAGAHSLRLLRARWRR